MYYKYEILIELPDDAAAVALTTTLFETGQKAIVPGSYNGVTVHGFVPVETPPEEVEEPKVRPIEREKFKKKRLFKGWEKT